MTDTKTDPTPIARLFPAAPGMTYCIVQIVDKKYIRRVELMKNWFFLAPDGELEHVTSNSLINKLDVACDHEMCIEFLNALSEGSKPTIHTASPEDTLIIQGSKG